MGSTVLLWHLKYWASGEFLELGSCDAETNGEGSQRGRGLRVVFQGVGRWEVRLWVGVYLLAHPLLTSPDFFFYEEKPGSCPKVDLPLTPLGLCRDQCQVDSECPDQMKCCLNGCGKVSCVTPVF